MTNETAVPPLCQCGRAMRHVDAGVWQCPLREDHLGHDSWAADWPYDPELKNPTNLLGEAPTREEQLAKKKFPDL